MILLVRREIVTIKIYEATSPPPTPVYLDFDNYTLNIYGNGQDVTPDNNSLYDDGYTLNLWGNTWKCVPYSYTITSNTILEFDFKSSAEGEIHAIGLDNNNDQNDDGGRGLQVYGTDTWCYTSYTDYTGTAYKYYEIPIGTYYTGSMDRLFFVNDHDIANPTGESYFKNVRLYECE